MAEDAANPGGAPIEASTELRAGVAADRSQVLEGPQPAFYGYNRPGAKISEGVRESIRAAKHDGRFSRLIFLHQGIFGDRSSPRI